MIVDSFAGKVVVYKFCDDGTEKQTFEGDDVVNVRFLRHINITAEKLLSPSNVQTILRNFIDAREQWLQKAKEEAKKKAESERKAKEEAEQKAEGVNYLWVVVNKSQKKINAAEQSIEKL